MWSQARPRIRGDETLAQRDDRNFAELIQELRVAGLGVQVLFGFLLSLPFTTRFAELSTRAAGPLPGVRDPRRRGDDRC